MNRKDRLGNLVKYMQKQMTAFPDTLPREKLDAKGKVDAWSAKDNFFHAVYWAQKRLDILETLEKGKEWEDSQFDHYDDENKVIFQQFKDRSWKDASEMSRTAYRGILAYLDRVTEETLLGAQEGEERKNWRSIVDYFVSHPMIHLWEQLVAAKKIDTLGQMFGEDYFNLLLDVDDSDNYQGGVFYNRACLLALVGDHQQAVEQLEKALTMNPDLIEWSTQDTDLDSLRDYPAYQALYTDL